jgi:hypothetical protein
MPIPLASMQHVIFKSIRIYLFTLHYLPVNCLQEYITYRKNIPLFFKIHCRMDKKWPKFRKYNA